MDEALFSAVAAGNVAYGLGAVVAFYVYRRNRNREALETRLIAGLVLIAWLRFFVGLPTARGLTSAAVLAGLLAMTIYMLRPPQVRHLSPWLPTRFKHTTEGEEPNG